MDKLKLLTKGIAAGLSSACIFPHYNMDDIKIEPPELGLRAAFQDVGEAFQTASDCLQEGIDESAKF